jgi:hypothetical protein
MDNFLPQAWVVRSDKDTHFTGALALNAMELEVIGDAAPTSSNRVPTIRSKITRITILSEQNLAWDIMLFKAAFAPPLTADCDLHPLVDWLSFTAADGVRVGAAGVFMYSWSGFSFPYYTTDVMGRIHAGLINRDAVAKLANGAGGAIAVEIEGVSA